MILINLPREEKLKLMRRIQTYFDEERSEVIGDLAAGQLLDFMLKELGPYTYNKALADARHLITERFAQIDEDLYTLERPREAR